MNIQIVVRGGANGTERLNNRIRPKVLLPIKLGDQCLTLVVKQLTGASSQLDRNSKEKKALRAYLSQNLPESLLQQILERVVDVSTLEEALNVLDVLPPERFAKTSVDLIGSNRFEIRCAISQFLERLRLPTGYRFHPFLNRQQLDKLYNILLWSSPAHLQHLSFGVLADNDIRTSNLPNILARAHSLTKLVMFAGADDHILRIVGLNCPSLRFLDVSFSKRVTDNGFQGLLLRRPSKRKPKPILAAGLLLIGHTKSTLDNANHFNQLVASERNPCASSLESIMVSGTGISSKGIQFICKVLQNGYFFYQYPYMRVFRLKRLTKMHLMEATPATVEEVTTCMENVLDPTLRDVCRLELFKGINDEKLALCIIAESEVGMCRIESDRITSLVMPISLDLGGDNFTVDVANLGRLLPNLRFFRGALHNDAISLENDYGQYLLPHLQVVNAHFSEDSSIVPFLLRFAPSLKSLVADYSYEYEGAEENLQLTDGSVERCLTEKKANEKNLEEIIICSEFLTTRALKCFVDCLPKLEKIGDIDLWEEVTLEDIDDFNRYLDATNSQCVLSLADNPSAKEDQKEYNSVLNFMNY